MKKIALFLAVGVMAFGLTACGSGDSGQSGESQAGTTTETSSTESSSAGDDSQETEPGDVGDVTGDDFDAEGGWSAQMQAIRDAVAEELGDDYWPNMEIPADVLEGMYGVTSDMYEDYMGEMPMMSVHVDTLVIVKAKDGQAEAVESALNAYRDKVVSDTMQYPMNLGKIQASKVERIGDYVCYVQLGGDVTEAEEKGDEEVITHCQEQNDRAIEVIAGCLER